MAMQYTDDFDTRFQYSVENQMRVKDMDARRRLKFVPFTVKFRRFCNLLECLKELLK